VQVITADELAAAIAALESGLVVAVPTDTVYGLAARLSTEGVAALFSLKARSTERAVPVIVGSLEQARAVAADWPESADRLARHFWPGALTLVVPASAVIGGLVGGPGDTVGVRWPRHGVLGALCAALGPLAVTSANRHGVPPATTLNELGTAFPVDAGPALAVDGGLCDGIPSTVVDCTVEPARCLRDGGVPWRDIDAVLSDAGGR